MAEDDRRQSTNRPAEAAALEPWEPPRLQKLDLSKETSFNFVNGADGGGGFSDAS